MGFGQGTGPGGASATRLLPDDIDPNLEIIANLMIRVLSSRSRPSTPSPGPRSGCPTPTSWPATARRPRSSSYIRADETPHVGYLKTALTEMRDRTWIGDVAARSTPAPR